MEARLLYVTGSLAVGGAERQLAWLLRTMDRDLWRPAVLALTGSEEDRFARELRELGVPVRVLPPGTGRLGKLRAVRLLARGAEVVHAYAFYANILVHLATRGTPAIPIGCMRSELSRQYRLEPRPLFLACVRWPRWQIWNSWAAREEHRRLLGRPARPEIRVVTNRLDLSRFDPGTPPAAGPPLIVGIGRLHGVKRWDRLVRAAGELRRRGCCFRVRIAGGGPDGDALLALATREGVRDLVEFPGEIADVPGFLREAAIVAHTAESEGCPNAVMEGMAAGRPVVATAVGDVPRLVEEGVTGRVVPGEDTRALADALQSLLGDPGARERMGRAARARAEQQLGISSLVPETLGVYREAGWAGRE
jgi:glycosyltransferase involved in cell wall biosynthesis